MGMCPGRVHVQSEEAEINAANPKNGGYIAVSMPIVCLDSE